MYISNYVTLRYIIGQLTLTHQLTNVARIA